MTRCREIKREEYMMNNEFIGDMIRGVFCYCQKRISSRT